MGMRLQRHPNQVGMNRIMFFLKKLMYTVYIIFMVFRYFHELSISCLYEGCLKNGMKFIYMAILSGYILYSSLSIFLLLLV